MGKTAIESKKAMRKRGVASPDRFEALVYSHATDILDAGDAFFFGIT